MFKKFSCRWQVLKRFINISVEGRG